MGLQLSDREWKPFKIEKVFEVNKGKYLNKKDILKGFTPLISAKAMNNGTTEFVGNNPLFKGNSITIEKIKLSAYYQPSDFYCSHDVTVLRNKELNKSNSLFANSIINRQGVKYSYGRQAQMSVVKKETILLPSLNHRPDWSFMEKYMKQQEKIKKTTYNKYLKQQFKDIKYKEIVDISRKDWKGFEVDSLFYVGSGQDIIGDNQILGDIPYVSASTLNNGISNFLSNDNKSKIEDIITVSRTGAAGYAFYHKKSSLISNNCRTLKNKFIDNNEFVSLFLTNQITQQKSKYNYGYIMGTTRLKKQKIMLPVDKDNHPDYEYMEQYMKNLMIVKYNQYYKFSKKQLKNLS